jgi:hypothetical protein
LLFSKSASLGAYVTCLAARQFALKSRLMKVDARASSARSIKLLMGLAKAARLRFVQFNRLGEKT